MANEEHVKLLSQGVQKWNEWRQKHPQILPDLREVDLTGADLTGANLFEANLSRADLDRANLSQANLSRARAIALKSVSKHQLGEIGLIPAGFEAFVLDADICRRVLA
jgi:Pentapeptide repeats (8 copies)